MNFPVLLFLMSVLAGDPPVADQSPPTAGNCQFVIDGEDVEKLTLATPPGPMGYVVVTAPAASLPAGKYHVDEVVLKGGYTYSYDGGTGPTVTLVPGVPFHYRPALPLMPGVEATRRGRLLDLNYRLTDVEGRVCRSGRQREPPKFAIFQGDQQIAAGSFEYG